MKEFMLLIRNEIDHQKSWPEAKHKKFLKSCENYIDRLKRGNHLIAAQPLMREGKIISGSIGTWKESPIGKSKEVQVGYYLIRADNISEAITLAKENPEFEFSASAKIEVRPVKMKEETTGFVYPKEINSKP
ncbi:MAG: hypothetical protein HYR67_00180 [Bacteroidetes bacterium]|nr:hypothetical protein [Bacteroidota bacterium]